MAIKINRSPKANDISLPGSVFYKEDMKDIFQTLKRRGPEGEAKVKVAIDGGEYEIDEVVDFDSEVLEGKRFRDIKFEAVYGNSLVTVELFSDSGRVTEVREEDDIVMTGVAQKVEEIAGNRENHLKSFSVVILLAASVLPLYLLAERTLVTPIVGASSALGYPISREVLVEDELLGVICAALYIPVMILFLKKMKLKGNVLINSFKGKSRLFRDRLLDNWQVSAFWAVVGAAIGSFLGRIIS